MTSATPPADKHVSTRAFTVEQSVWRAVPGLSIVVATTALEAEEPVEVAVNDRPEALLHRCLDGHGAV